MPKRGPKIRLGSYFDLNGSGLSLGQSSGVTPPVGNAGKPIGLLLALTKAS